MKTKKTFVPCHAGKFRPKANHHKESAKSTSSLLNTSENNHLDAALVLSGLGFRHLHSKVGRVILSKPNACRGGPILCFETERPRSLPKSNARPRGKSHVSGLGNKESLKNRRQSNAKTLGSVEAKLLSNTKPTVDNMFHFVWTYLQACKYPGSSRKEMQMHLSTSWQQS